MLLQRNRRFLRWRRRFDFRLAAARAFLSLNAVGVRPLLLRHVVQVVGDVKHAAVVDPTVVLGSASTMSEPNQAKSQDQAKVGFHDDTKSSMFLGFRRNKV